MNFVLVPGGDRQQLLDSFFSLESGLQDVLVHVIGVTASSSTAMKKALAVLKRHLSCFPTLEPIVEDAAMIMLANEGLGYLPKPVGMHAVTAGEVCVATVAQARCIQCTH